MTKHTNPISIADAEALIERYFSAETSEGEERVLRAFLMSDEGADERFDEVRATMSYLSVGRSYHHRSHRSSHRIAAIAASLLVAVTLGLMGWYVSQPTDLCQATVAGETISQEKATQLMLSQMQDMFNPDNSTKP